jgi:ATP-dependent Clp protease ATP-binding subunit ClpB
MDALRKAFKPEFLNRVDDVIVFHTLGKEHLIKIIDLQLARVAKLLADRRLGLDVTPEAKELLLTEGYDPVYGARSLKRVIQRDIQNPLALALLEGGYADGDTIKVVRSGDTLDFVKTSPPVTKPHPLSPSPHTGRGGT